LAIYRYTVYKSPNIGIFVKANDSIMLLPHGFAETKSEKLAEYLQVREVMASVAGTRLIGPMTVMNNNGILLPPIASDEEVQALRQSSQLNVERINSKFTAIGNLIAANDNGAIVSPLFRREADRQVQDVLGVLTHSMTVALSRQGRWSLLQTPARACTQKPPRTRSGRFLKSCRCQRSR
jgi:translation initiation factor 6